MTRLPWAVCLCMFLTTTEADTDTINELREKTTRISDELEGYKTREQGYKNAVASLSPHLKGLIRKEVEATQTCVSSSVGGTCVEPDKKEMSKGAKVTINIGEGWDSENKKIHLNSDFNCPTGADTSTWIESIYINNITSADYLSDGEFYTPAQFVVQQGDHRRRVAIGTSMLQGTRMRRRASGTGDWDNGVYYDGDTNQKVSNWQWFPSTSKVMRDRGNGQFEDYYNGIFQGTSKKSVDADWEETSFWKIDDGDCYAMAAYMATRVSEETKFKYKSDQIFNRKAMIRALKFSLCKMVDSVPKCAVRKAVVSCWYQKTDNSWQECEDDDLFSASILSRS